MRHFFWIAVQAEFQIHDTQNPLVCNNFCLFGYSSSSNSDEWKKLRTELDVAANKMAASKVVVRLVDCLVHTCNFTLPHFVFHHRNESIVYNPGYQVEARHINRFAEAVLEVVHALWSSHLLDLFTVSLTEIAVFLFSDADPKDEDSGYSKIAAQEIQPTLVSYGNQEAETKTLQHAVLEEMKRQNREDCFSVDVKLYGQGRSNGPESEKQKLPFDAKCRIVKNAYRTNLQYSIESENRILKITSTSKNKQHFESLLVKCCQERPEIVTHNLADVWAVIYRPYDGTFTPVQKNNVRNEILDARIAPVGYVGKGFRNWRAKKFANYFDRVGFNSVMEQYIVALTSGAFVILFFVKNHDTERIENEFLAHRPNHVHLIIVSCCNDVVVKTLMAVVGLLEHEIGNFQVRALYGQASNFTMVRAGLRSFSKYQPDVEINSGFSLIDFAKKVQKKQILQYYINSKSSIVGNYMNEITDVDFEEWVLNPTFDFVVNFYAPWCGWCRKLAPTWEELARHVHTSTSGIKIGRFDKDKNESPWLEVNSFPLIVLYRYVEGSSPIEQFQSRKTYYGDRSLPSLIAWINRNSRYQIPSQVHDVVDDDLNLDDKVDL